MLFREGESGGGGDREKGLRIGIIRISLHLSQSPRLPFLPYPFPGSVQSRTEQTGQTEPEECS
jgi:hypothetical protein